MEVITLTLPDENQIQFQIAFVDEPAIESNFLAFKKDHAVKFQFKELDKTQRKVMGYFMIADMEIPRWDEQRGAYKVIFPRESIRKIVRNWAVNGLNKNLNEMHRTNEFAKGVFVLNHWELDSALGIGAPTGFTVEADGSWFGIVQCDNDEIYQKCISGEYSGFSIECMFIEQDPLMAELERILSESNI